MGSEETSCSEYLLMDGKSQGGYGTDKINNSAQTQGLTRIKRDGGQNGFDIVY